MATKWKNSIVFIVWTLLFTSGVSGLFTFYLYMNEYQGSYFETIEFEYKVVPFIEYLHEYELYNIPLKEAKQLIKVTDEDIKEHCYRYGNLDEQLENIKEQYKKRIGDAYAEENKKEGQVLIAERDKKLEDIKENFESDKHIEPKVKKEKEAILEDFYKEKESYYGDYQSYTKDFTYYFQNDQTGKVYTNLTSSERQSGKNSINSKNMLFHTNYTITEDTYDHGYIEYKLIDLIRRNVITAKQEGKFVGEIGISKSLDSSSPLMQEYHQYEYAKKTLFIYSIACMAAFILAFVIGIKSKISSKVSNACEGIYRKIPFDLQWVLFLTSFIFAIVCVGVVITEFSNPETVGTYESIRDIILFLSIGACCWGFAVIQGKLIWKICRKLQLLKQAWQKSLISRIISFIRNFVKKTGVRIRDAFLNRNVGTQLFIMLAAIFGLGLLAAVAIIDPVFMLIYILVLVFVGTPITMILVKKIGYFNQIVIKTNELAEGKLGPDLEVYGKTVFAQLAGNINLLTEAVKNSQSEQAKSERMKSELITNVSHDLRTPLTSIITYTQLLQSGAVTKEDQASYLGIIDRKSKRLKVLIDDLFEVSKMASGNIDLKKERVDIVQLLQQALAEHDESITESTLQFRVTHKEKPIFVLVDGQKIWRVFDNLIGNILKYSLDHSRVYITVEKADEQVIITFKNISKYELSGNSEELHERFKRGDTSRHTEGSGLGLAIAKSIVELHNGMFQMETDGDLFKVSISLKEE